MYATSSDTFFLATLRVHLRWPTVIYHLQSRPAEQLTAYENVSHQNTPPSLSTASACPCSPARQKRLGLTSHLLASKTLNSPHRHRHRQHQPPGNLPPSTPNIPCSTPPPPPPHFLLPCPHRARAPSHASPRNKYADADADIPADRPRFLTPRIARSNLVLYRERAALVQKRHELKK
jgi:hypothetical protein